MDPIAEARARLNELGSKETLTPKEEHEFMSLCKKAKLDRTCTIDESLVAIVDMLKVNSGKDKSGEFAKYASTHRKQFESWGVNLSGNKTRDRLRAKLEKISK